MARIFVYDGREHPDPDTGATVEQIQEILSMTYPEIATAKHRTEKRDQDTLHIFTKQVGTKGALAPGDLGRILAETPATELDAVSIFAQLASPDGSVTSERLTGYAQAHPDNQQQLDQAVDRATRYVSSTRQFAARISQMTAP